MTKKILAGVTQEDELYFLEIDTDKNQRSDIIKL
jgi:hypothetical protein